MTPWGEGVRPVSAPYWAPEVPPWLPTISIDPAAALVLAERERKGAEHMRKLAREVADLHDGVLVLLLEWMAKDSEMHERILRLVARRAESPA